MTTLPPSPDGKFRRATRRKDKKTPKDRGLGIWSGKRDSNSRPQPWQGCALPTELFPQRELGILMPKNRPSSNLLLKMVHLAVTAMAGLG